MKSNENWPTGSLPKFKIWTFFVFLYHLLENCKNHYLYGKSWCFCYWIVIITLGTTNFEKKRKKILRPSPPSWLERIYLRCSPHSFLSLYTFISGSLSDHILIRIHPKKYIDPIRVEQIPYSRKKIHLETTKIKCYRIRIRHSVPNNTCVQDNYFSIQSNLVLRTRLILTGSKLNKKKRFKKTRPDQSNQKRPDLTLKKSDPDSNINNQCG